MNQANEDSNVVIAGIQAVETEKGMEVPAYKKGPKMINIRMGQDVQEIITRTSELLENGQLLDENGNKIVTFEQEGISELKANRKERKTEKIISNNKVEAKRKQRATKKNVDNEIAM